MSADLGEAKQKLLDRLGPNYGIYIQLLGKWFRGSISKEEFDRSAKQLIQQNFVIEHNKFWLAFFHHCANSAASSVQAHSIHLDDRSNNRYCQNSSSHDSRSTNLGYSPDSTSANLDTGNASYTGIKVRCLPNKVITHMKIFVIAWEMGLDSASDNVALYLNLALQHFLKNIITELICTKTAYRLRENRFKYAIGVKPMNPYLNNSLKIYSSNLEYDPYQIESNKMNSSLVDAYAYSDSLFPSRLYEAQALYEFACSTTSVSEPPLKKSRWLKLPLLSEAGIDVSTECETDGSDKKSTIDEEKEESSCDETSDRISTQTIGQKGRDSERRLTLFHLLIAFLTNRTIIPSQSLYSINLERILTKLS